MSMAKKRKAWGGDGWALDRGIQQHPITAVQPLYLLDRLKQVSNRVELREIEKKCSKSYQLCKTVVVPKKKQRQVKDT